MYSHFQIVRKFLRYYLVASNGKGHGTHSPFVFNFVKNILNDGRPYAEYAAIEQLRQSLLKDKTAIEVRDFGAGSAIANTAKRTIAAIARNAAKPQKYGRLLFRIARYFQPGNILELGTSLGLSTAYLSTGYAGAKVFTMEGAETVADVAENNFRRLGLVNIRVTRGNFDETLADLLAHVGTIDLAFIDGNHRKTPTLDYFDELLKHGKESSVFIFDDIHWSADMEAAWEAIKINPAVTVTIDLFFIGIVFFRKDFRFTQHFTIRF